MTTPSKKLPRMSDELWQSYSLFTDPLSRRSDPVLVKAVVRDVYQLYRVMSGMDATETPNPQLLAAMGDELAQAYDLFCKEPLRVGGDPIVVLDVLKDLDEMCSRMENEAEPELAPEEDGAGARPH